MDYYVVSRSSSDPSFWQLFFSLSIAMSITAARILSYYVSMVR